jgi:hypothetical protein
MEGFGLNFDIHSGRRCFILFSEFVLLFCCPMFFIGFRRVRDMNLVILGDHPD